MRPVFVLSLFVIACSSPAGTPPANPDASPPDGAPPPPPTHILISEVYTGIAMYELVEIHNPTDAAVSLSDYYLADNDQYHLVPAITGSTAGPVVGDADFIVRFPDGASIAAGETIVVARDGAGYQGRFGMAPTFSINGTGAPAMRAVDVGADAQLADTGEGIALFTWDGASDLVTDVDIVAVGIPQASNRTANKSGVSVDGPDADSLATTYADDAFTMPDFDDVTVETTSYKRVAIEGFDERATGGNGLGGHDETAEQTTRTWGQGATFSAPTPGTVPDLY